MGGCGAADLGRAVLVHKLCFEDETPTVVVAHAHGTFGSVVYDAPEMKTCVQHVNGMLASAPFAPSCLSCLASGSITTYGHLALCFNGTDLTQTNRCGYQEGLTLSSLLAGANSAKSFCQCNSAGCSGAACTLKLQAVTPHLGRLGNDHSDDATACGGCALTSTSNYIGYPAAAARTCNSPAEAAATTTPSPSSSGAASAEDVLGLGLGMALLVVSAVLVGSLGVGYMLWRRFRSNPQSPTVGFPMQTTQAELGVVSGKP